ncbi:hypothetical protein PV516_19055 [Streptomyces scabiei]|uniref:hypothetical protein n=1 Tax=Streptomyces scabiei TaxID=1930 RepID=UPI0029AAB341|nr:hypothetical protein [Streptomyces scabiei]MDX3165887.1 hypothetical protein [Streptomyces scabiei]
MCIIGPRIGYMELSPGDELGLDLAPTCCDDEMTGKPLDQWGYRDYECGTCHTVLEVTDAGVVWEIREKTAA